MRDEENEPWHGLFFMVKRPNIAQGYFLYVHAELVTDGSTQRPGWVSTTLSR